MDGPAKEDFVEFARDVEPGVRLAVVAAYGPDPGLDATQEALIWAWEHWGRVVRLTNPAGYLYRVAMRRAARMVARRPVGTPVIPGDAVPWVEPALSSALERLSEKQRQVVVLVEAYGYTQQETAELLGVRRSTIQTHLERGLAGLREALGVGNDD